jgi:mRNA interferase RelE/StbE
MRYSVAVRGISYTRRAAKELLALGSKDRERILAKLKQYAAYPKSLANQVKALKGSSALRLRAGDYRVSFTDDGIVLLILKIGNRRDVYD